MPVARRFTIKGRVQGVFFRDSTRREAVALGLTGHAINLPNGDVQVLACGDLAVIEQLGRWLKQGPPLSQVISVSEEEAVLETLTDFVTS